MNYSNNDFDSVDFTLVSQQQRNRRVNLRITDNEKEWIAHMAEKQQVNSSDIIRQALREYKKKKEDGHDVL